jgi:regulator of sirC expression with transglutaminase-like and TPR domain
VPFPHDRAALLIAVDEYPFLDLKTYEERLDDYAQRVAQAHSRSRSEDTRMRLAALRRVIFEEEGFHGNREQYYDVRNCYLNEVLDRHLGIPITLAALLIGVARRLDWELEPVNFPAHVLLRCRTENEDLAVDPFHGGLIIGRTELADRWTRATNTPAPSVQTMLRPAEPSSVLVRMLNNIWMMHANAHRYGVAALAKEKVALIEPGDPGHERDLGYLLAGAGQVEAAVSRLAGYLERAPHASDRERVRRHLDRLEAAAEGGD